MLGKWKIINSKTTFEDKWLKIRSDRCVTPNGRIIYPYHVIEQSKWVNVLALTNEFDAILVKQYRHGANQVLEGFPAGSVENTDANIESAIRRELLEETGYSGVDFHEIGVSYANPANQNNTVHSFIAVDVSRVANPDLDIEEDIEVTLAPFVDLVKTYWIRRNSGELQALYVTALFFAIAFILETNNKVLLPLQAELRKLLNK